MKNKIAEAVCIATQKTNYSCEKIKHTCKKRGGCAYCLVMAEELIANALERATPKSPKDDGWLYCPVCGKDICVDKPNYCSDCGQRIDWGGANG